MSKPTDTEMLDWLEHQHAFATYTGRCIFRWSATGRGWRLHETDIDGALPTVRKALSTAMIRAPATIMEEDPGTT